MRSLDSLGLEFGTDKSSADHNYLPFYERYFIALRERPIRLLEIDVLGGASLSLWETYFPHALIIGADINVSTQRFARARVAVETVDQSNVKQLVQLGLKYGPFEIIIDDGSHKWDHQITTPLYIAGHWQLHRRNHAGGNRGWPSLRLQRKTRLALRPTDHSKPKAELIPGRDESDVYQSRQVDAVTEENKPFFFFTRIQLASA